MGEMRNIRRQRRYVAKRWLVVLKPVLRYSHTREAFIIRGVGTSVGPVLRVDRRRTRRKGDAAEHRQARIA
jgi:hypothetical protein